MGYLKNLRIGARLGAGFAAVLLLTVALGLLALNRIGFVNAATADLAGNWMPATRALNEVSAALNTMRRLENNLLQASTPAQRSAEEQALAQVEAAAQQAWKRYLATVTTDAERQVVAEAEQALGAYYALHKQLKTLSADPEAGLPRALEMFGGEARTAFNTLVAQMQRCIDFQTQGADQAYAQSQAAYQQTVWLVGSLLLGVVVLGAVLAWWITRSITGPIRQAVAVAETVAQGDLRTRIEVSSRDETGQLLAALKRMNEALVGIATTVRGNAENVATASTQIAQGNIDLSQRTEEQASNLQQTAASMEQLTATVQHNADTSRQAAQLAGSASTVAEQGGEVVGRVVATMEDISASSRKIADIIGVIDGIAFQTNILALNAAVEAARAGEQGRGFAVVAGEVRTLAQRSAEAAREIKSLIGASVERVEAGSALVSDAGRTMGEIVGQVKRVTDLIAEISAASTEQSSGIGQVSDAVAQLDQVTQQNAALVEESAAAAESLKVQAAQMAQTVSFFTLDERAGAVARAR